MAEENQKNEVRVEDRRHFDKDGNPIKTDEPEKASKESENAPRQHASTDHVPGIDFPSLIFLYLQTALIHLGELEDPAEGKMAPNLDAARQIINIVELLCEKTKGNLSPQEDDYIEKVLFDLRLLYVQKAKKS